MGTLSKAFGSQGGYVCGAREMIDYLINKCRSFIYTTAISPMCAGASLKALEIIQAESERRKTLLANSEVFRDKLKSIGADTLSSESQIIPLLAGSVEKALEISKTLFDSGIFAPSIRPPTVPENKARLRFSLTYEHTKDDIEKVIELLQRNNL
jgi:8-amino-7-oxononanoate synthase